METVTLFILPLAGKVGPASLSENTMGENLPVFTAFALEITPHLPTVGKLFTRRTPVL